MNIQLPTTARIVQFHRAGGPEVLQLDELPLPNPAAGEVRLRVKAIGLNRSEIEFRKGDWLKGGETGVTAARPIFPSKIGYEASGIVEAVGPSVDRSWIGQTVSTLPIFDAMIYGVAGEVAIVPVFALACYPSHLSFEEGASIWMAYLTAYGGLVQIGGIQNGDVVVITAASSSVGLAAIEIARAEGATSIATTRSGGKMAELLAAGADHVIVTEHGDLVTRVAHITGGKGARLIFDPIGGRLLEDLAAASARNGLIIEYGALAGEPTSYPSLLAMSKALTIKGYTVYEVVSDPEALATAKNYVFERLACRTMRPRIDKTFKLEDIVEAHRYLESNVQIGKIVVTV